MTEEDLQAAVIDLARLCGWLVHAERPGRTAQGWRTPVQGHPGFPDLVLAHREHGLILVELKSARGDLSVPQQIWRSYLAVAGTRWRYCIWRPGGWLDGSIERVLRGEA